MHKAAVASSLLFLTVNILDVDRNSCLISSENEFIDIRIFYPLNYDILLILSKLSTDNLQTIKNH
jgi:hypothetical protein